MQDSKTAEQLPTNASGQVSRRITVWLTGIGLVMIAGLNLMGRSGWCPQMDFVPWSWDVWSAHCSQHFVDPYSLSHFQHGLGLFLILSVCFKNQMSLFAKTATVGAIEALWEFTENTSFMINRYRETTVSLDYYGDSITNSVGDYLFCLLGVYVSFKLPHRFTITVFVAAEIISLIWIRDSLMINIIMLICPIEAIKNWQMPLPVK